MFVKSWGALEILQFKSVKRITQAFVKIDEDLFCHDIGKFLQSLFILFSSVCRFCNFKCSPINE